MAKHLRAGITVALLFSAIASGAAFVLNPRFVDDFLLGLVLLVVLPVLFGAVFGVVFGRLLDRLAHIGSNEDTNRAYVLLWASVAGFVTFPATLAFLPPYLSVFNPSEVVRYGGGLVLALGFAFAASQIVRVMVERPRHLLWPVLLALPLFLLFSGTRGARGLGSGSNVLLLAFPGLSWSVAGDLIERGQMPNLTQLRRLGSWGDLQSVRPLMAPVVWTSFATGKTAEEHRVQGFTATARDVDSYRVWEIFENRGWSIGLFGWPVTWPPRRVDGFVVPSSSDYGTETYPPDLSFIRKIAMTEKTGRKRAWGQYCRFAFLGARYGARLGTLVAAGREIATEPFRRGSLDAARVFSRRKLQARLNTDYFVELRRQKAPDFAAYHTNIIQVAQANFWKFHEPDAFGDISPDNIDRYGESVHDAYRIVDEFIGRIIDDADENRLVVVVSDHGPEALRTSPSKALTLRIEPLLRRMNLKKAVEATNLGARTFLRMKRGHEGDLNRIRRLFETARLGTGDERVFSARVDEWGNLVVTVQPGAVDAMDDTILYQGGRCPVAEVVRTVEFQESARMVETGAIVLQGEGVRRNWHFGRADLLDVVPTMLVLNEFDLAADLPGDVIHDSLNETFRHKIPGMVATYERGGRPERAASKAQPEG